MFGRIWRYIQGLLGIKLDQLEDPEILLQQAQQEMRENQAKNRERAVQAITQKNNLQAEADKTQKVVDNLQAKAELALKNGDRDLARQLLVEKGQYETTLTTIQQSLQSAVETTEAIKVAIRREEERIRAKTAQAMALKTQWKQSQIEISLNKALEGMTTDGTDHAFERAAAKISNAHSESQARTELAKESLNGRLAKLDDVEMDANADAQLAEMEQRMGLGPKPQATTSTTSASVTPAATSEVDRQLQELEARVGGGGGNTAGRGRESSLGLEAPGYYRLRRGKPLRGCGKAVLFPSSAPEGLCSEQPCPSGHGSSHGTAQAISE